MGPLLTRLVKVASEGAQVEVPSRTFPDPSLFPIMEVDRGGNGPMKVVSNNFPIMEVDRVEMAQKESRLSKAPCQLP